MTPRGHAIACPRTPGWTAQLGSFEVSASLGTKNRPFQQARNAPQSGFSSFTTCPRNRGAHPRECSSMFALAMEV